MERIDKLGNSVSSSLFPGPYRDGQLFAHILAYIQLSHYTLLPIM